ncbi:MAG: crossover junction endodeoxyribonuclease RuvC [Phycisphaerae bacterium]|jgi:crossover junction endodeoxyribonuclease RuvC|nr:crossover junction endodeoxyribonuclease RuvC [Phycisphaerae bacterium]|tara:strand:- start:5926 stop:6438 length:513 start_codon:yes stop_codon:yes gene_type:complete
MRILGIDPGLRITGYACLEVTPGAALPRVVEAGVFRIDTRATLEIRLNSLHEDLDSTLEDLKPDFVAVETLFSHYRRARTAILMAHARGVVLVACAKRGLSVSDFVATEVKKAVTGNGHADKDQVQEAVTHQLGLKERPSPYDVSDAMAIALCAARRSETIRTSDYSEAV